MKKKQLIHPKLYLEIIRKNDLAIISYKQNKFNKDGSRKIELEEILNNKNIDKIILKNKNEQQLEILKRYIKTQKRVLEKYEKVRNYNAGKVVENSIHLLNEFENDFINWFIKNKDLK